jgi:dTDP-4-dehydrorhamnose reductase
MMVTKQKLKVLLLGSSGLLGCTLKPFLVSHGYIVSTNSRSDGDQYQVDFIYPSDAYELLEQINPDIIINLIGLTDVDLCETNPNLAYLINVRTVENIVAWILKKRTQCYLVHMSTDQVYDGNSLKTEAQVKLTNYYAFSKYTAELAALKVSSLILRTNFFGRSNCRKRKSLTDWLFSSISNNEQIQVFSDIMFSPLSMMTLSELIHECINKRLVGVFNAGSNEGMSKADFSFSFAAELSLPTKRIKQSTTDQVTFLKAYRPKDMRMSSLSIENTLRVRLPDLTNEIKRVAEEYREIT